MTDYQNTILKVAKIEAAPIYEILERMMNTSKCDLCGEQALIHVGEPGDLYSMDLCEKHYEIPTHNIYMRLKTLIWKNLSVKTKECQHEHLQVVSMGAHPKRFYCYDCDKKLIAIKFKEYT